MLPFHLNSNYFFLDDAIADSVEFLNGSIEFRNELLVLPDGLANLPPDLFRLERGLC